MRARSAIIVRAAIAQNHTRVCPALLTIVSNSDDNRDQRRCACECARLARVRYFIFAARRFTCDLSQTFVDALTATK